MKTQLNDIQAGYIPSGQGPAVVLVHGLAEDRQSWTDVQRRLGVYRTYAVDLRGHGETTIGDADGTLAQLGGDLITFLETVTGPATCVGYSLGGTVVLWAAAQRPDLIPHVVVTGTSSVVGRAAVAFFESRIELIQQDFNAFSVELKSDTAAQLVSPGVQLDEVARRRVIAINDGQGYVNAARAMVRLASDPLTPLLSKIACPVDAIYADQDVFCPEKAVDILAKSLPRTTRRKITGAGHLMSVDQPQAYADTIRAALDACAHQQSTEPRK